MRRPLLLVLLAVLACCLTFQPAQGQFTDRTPYINVDFPGGTFAEYVAAVQDAAGDQLNIVTFDETARKLKVPPMRLRQIVPNMAISALGNVDLEYQGEAYRLMIEQLPGTKPDGPANLRIGSLKMSREAAPVVRVRTTVFAAQPLLDAGLEAEHLLSAVEIALNLTAKDQPADVRFHEETGLIFASGTIDQINAIHELMATLRESLTTRLTKPLEDRERQVQEAREQTERLRAELDETRAHLEEMAAERAALQAELRAREMERQRAEEDAQRRVELVQQQLEQQAAMLRERAEQQAEIAREQVRAKMEGELTRIELERKDLERRLEELQAERKKNGGG